MHTCAHTHTHTYIHAHAHTHTYTHMHTHTHTHTNIHTHTYTLWYRHKRKRTRTYIYRKYSKLHTQTQAETHTHIHTYTSGTHRYTRKHTREETHMQSHTYTCTFVNIHTYRHARTHTHVHVMLAPLAPVDTHIDKHRHTDLICYRAWSQTCAWKIRTCWHKTVSMCKRDKLTCSVRTRGSSILEGELMRNPHRYWIGVSFPLLANKARHELKRRTFFTSMWYNCEKSELVAYTYSYWWGIEHNQPSFN